MSLNLLSAEDRSNTIATSSVCSSHIGTSSLVAPVASTIALAATRTLTDTTIFHNPDELRRVQVLISPTRVLPSCDRYSRACSRSLGYGGDEVTPELERLLLGAAHTFQNLLEPYTEFFYGIRGIVDLVRQRHDSIDGIGRVRSAWHRVRRLLLYGTGCRPRPAFPLATRRVMTNYLRRWWLLPAVADDNDSVLLAGHGDFAGTQLEIG